VLARLQANHPGVAVAASPRDVGAVSDIVVTMLPNGAHVQATALGPEGLIHGLKPGALLLDTSSSEPWHTTATAARLAEAGITVVDAPVSGAEAGAIAGELVFMVGGDDAAVERVRPLLDIMGKQMFHLGPIGAGHAMKSINNLITAVTFMATAEGLIAGKAFGLDPAVMTDVLNQSTGRSWISQTHIAQRILSRRFDDAFKLDLMVKDIGIALRVAGDLELDLPLSATAQALWLQAQAGIPAGSSVSELVRTIEARTGVDLTSPSLEAKARS
jgi:3-hydroxyisobutyrate dehydrogenase-like beta-hydroxyacid dehydrogenase